MHRSKKEIGVILCLMAMAGFVGWPLWKYFYIRSVDEALFSRTQAIVEKNPDLRPAWTIAMQDEVLTLPEAKVIVEGAGEKVEAEE